MMKYKSEATQCNLHFDKHQTKLNSLLIFTFLSIKPLMKKSSASAKIEAVPYFFGYKTEFFFFQNNPKDLDPSCKTDLELLDCLGRVNLVL